MSNQLENTARERPLMMGDQIRSDTGKYSNHTIAVYATHSQAEAAIRMLSKEGYDMKKLSLIGQHYQSEEQPVGFINTGDRMWLWGRYGAFWGAIWGLLFGSALLFVPGMGHIILGGYVVSALEGAIVGGGLGVIGGTLVSFGVPRDSIVRYESSIKAGNFVLIAHGDEEESKRASELLASTPTTRLDSYSS